MKTYIGCDAHKRYSMFISLDEEGQQRYALKVPHDRNEYRSYLHTLPPETPIALESIGNWYWMIDEIEKAGHFPQLVQARKAKLMMGHINKTDKLDAKGLATLLRNGTLPTVWIPPGELRDQRELPRMRMALVGVRTKLKNRIHSALSKYGIRIKVSDIFGKKGRVLIQDALQEIPPQTRDSVEVQLKLLDQVNEHLKKCEEQIKSVVEQTPMMKRLMTMPGVGSILAVVIALEIGDVRRFGGPERLASYSGTVPRIKSSGGKSHYGKIRSDVNRYLKWAFVEAANVVVANRNSWSDRHVSRLYRRIMQRKGHSKAVVAIARHLAEAAYWILRRDEPYLDPLKINVSSTRESTRARPETS
jgi:transposase